MSALLLTLLVVICVSMTIQAFMPISNTHRQLSKASSSLHMEYIPDGLSKAQWQAMKTQELEQRKSKNLGAVGIQKFKSRSMQAWQEAGGVHLFPTPTHTAAEERPYMQRKNGDWEGSDLKMKGLTGRKQGQAFQRLPTDNMYDDMKAKGLLNSVSIFSSILGAGDKLPWVIEDDTRTSTA